MGLRVSLLCVGRRDERYEAVASELCRLARPYAVLEVQYVRPPGRQDGSPAALAREAAALTARVPPGAHLVGLAVEGVALDSPGFSRWLARLRDESRPVAFLIGGAWGLDPSLRRSCASLLSLSRLTLSHRVALLVVLEQLYRGLTIIAGHPYHKE
jgi:23S rRNA (pseudouridine1915-N3)-methyltransferase